MTDDRDQIRARISIVDLVQERVNLKKKGKGWWGLCPFHPDKDPSMQVSEDTGGYRCWSCGARGDIFTWVMETEKVEFRDALEQLATRAGIELRKGAAAEQGRRSQYRRAMDLTVQFFTESLTKAKPILDYCERRGLTETVRQFWGLGYSPGEYELATFLKRSGANLAEAKELFLVDGDAQSGYFDKFRDRLMFPIRDERGQVVAFGGRIIGQGQPKYINSGDTPLFSKRKILYGLDRAKADIADQNRAVLVEGYMDVIACHRAGLTIAVASLGTALSEDQARLLRRWCKNVTILYDSDDAGKKAASRASEILTAEGLTVKVALLPQGQDPDSLLKEVGAEAVMRAAGAGLSPVEYALDQLRAKYGTESDEFWENVFDALKLCRDNLELETQLHNLAAHYPHLRDPQAAYRSLRKMANQRLRPQNGAATQAVGAPKLPQTPMPGAERCVLEAVLIEELRPLAWEILGEPDIFSSAKATSVQVACLETFPEDAPKGPTADWLGQLADPEARDLLADLALSRERPIGVIKVDEDAVTGAMKILLRKRQQVLLRRQRLEGKFDGEAALEFTRRWGQMLDD